MTDAKIIEFLRIYTAKYINAVLNEPSLVHLGNYECSECEQEQITVPKEKLEKIREGEEKIVKE